MGKTRIGRGIKFVTSTASSKIRKPTIEDKVIKDKSQALVEKKPLPTETPAKDDSVETAADTISSNDKLDHLAFDINTIFKRLEKKGELFQKVMDQKNAAANSKILNQFLGSFNCK